MKVPFASFLVRYYNLDKYPFAAVLSDFFEVKELALLHLERKDLLPESDLCFDTENITPFHKSYYARQNQGWNGIREVYDAFMAEVIAVIIAEPLYYQYMPTFRIQLPGQKAIHKWHYDSDPEHKHPLGEINFQIALTPMQSESATWCESSPGAADYFPMVLLPGQFLQFNGNLCRHGNQANTTGRTRVSLDFRVLPKRLYAENDAKASLISGKKFVPGSYYQELQL